MMRFVQLIPLTALLLVGTVGAQQPEGMPADFGARPIALSLSEVLRGESERLKDEANAVVVTDDEAGGTNEAADQVEMNHAADAYSTPPATPESPEHAEPVAPAPPAAQAPAHLPSTTARPGGSSAVRTNPRDHIKPAPPELTVDSGVNHVIGVAYSHLNRIITPFPNPTVKTTSLATTMVDGGIVYVATNLPEPIGLFIHDETSPDVAISLTLVPAEIPPISIRVHVRGFQADNMPLVRAEPTLATAFEQQHTYMDMLKVLMRDLAQGRIPDGYGLKPISGFFADMPTCAMPGIHIIPLQHVVGTSLQVVVGKAHNTSSLITEIREDACAGPGLRAIAAWPRTTLKPGEATEVYLVLDVPQEINSASQRPSLLGGLQ